MTDATAYPLLWPEGWPRTPAHLRESRNKFRVGSGFTSDPTSRTGSRYVGKKEISFDRARRLLADELSLLNAKNIVLSSNVELRLDGEPRAGAARAGLKDPGIAVYFTFKGKQMVMAQDAFQNVAANTRSLGLAIEAMRQLDRHGGGAMMERAFTGFLAITPPSWKKPWREVFGVKADWRGDIESLFRERAKELHPDRGGSNELMAELNLAIAEARQEIGGPT